MSLTIAWKDPVHLGNKILVSATVTGDGSTTTIDMPLTDLDTYWMQLGTQSTILGLSNSANTISYSAAPTNSATHDIFAIGWD